MCGFFQTLTTPLKQMGMKFWHRQLARLNFVPTLSLLINIIGLPTGAYALYLYITSFGPFPPWVMLLSAVNVILYIVVMGQVYLNTWKRSKLVLHETSTRAWYITRVNPLVLFLYYLLWSVPIAIGFGMFLADKGKAWVRTEKVDADRRFVSRTR